jgi:L-amino acid N-acyltransferase YncA
MIEIRKATGVDRPAIWAIFHEVVAQGDSYVFAPDISEEAAMAYWMGPQVQCYVAQEEGAVLGTFIIKDNQPGLGAHVANASFMVDKAARGKGVGRLMGEFALEEARRLGYRSMQFNIVIATNHAAVKLWQSLGFAIIGTAPQVFAHQQRGLVDAHIMFRHLQAE